MASVNAADRGITSSHNFWLPMADACCQTVEELLSFVTFSVAATDLDPDQLVLGPKNSHRSLAVTLCLPATICQLTRETSWKAFNLRRRTSWCHLNASRSVAALQILCWLLCVWFVSEIPPRRYETQSSGAEVSATSSASKCLSVL